MIILATLVILAAASGTGGYVWSRLGKRDRKRELAGM